MIKEFVPKDFVIPKSLKSNLFLLEVLSPEVAEIDYDAVMSSRVRLRSVFGKSTEWPSDNLSLEDNINDLEKHKKEFEERVAFAYTVLDLSRENCLGCVYIDPGKKSNFDCEIYLWVRDSHINLDSELYNTVKFWIESNWPFKQIVFPGREISWDKWNELQ